METCQSLCPLLHQSFKKKKKKKKGSLSECLDENLLRGLPVLARPERCNKSKGHLGLTALRAAASAASAGGISDRVTETKELIWHSHLSL